MQAILQAGAAVLATLGLCLVAGGCGGGGGGGNAQALLQQTFSGHHPLTSGQVSLNATLSPSGSSLLSTPIVLSLGGPFQSHGRGTLPESNFDIQLTALGQHGALQVISTGNAGYVELQGTGYQLPAKTFQQLESSFAGLAAAGGTGSTASALSRLGINPLSWLENPSVVGDETVSGVSTKHITASINTRALLGDIENFATHSSLPGASRAGLAQATLDKIAASIHSPTLDVWTGDSDHILRKLEVKLTVPVSGQVSTQLGGLTSLGIDFTLAYSQINQPQAIHAPATLAPFPQFEAKVRSIIAQVRSALKLLGGGGAGITGSGGGSSSASSSGGSGASGSSGASTTAAPAGYTQCIVDAHGDVTKMQKCASLLGSGG